MTIADDKLHRFTLEEYHQMADLGWFDEKRVELLEGQILEMSPQNEPHVNAVSSMFEFLREHLPKGLYRIRCQAPVRTGEQSEPEPDFAIVAAP